MLKKVDFYWSDRWQRRINVYQCAACGKEMTDLNKARPALTKEHAQACNESHEKPLEPGESSRSANCGEPR